MRISADDPQIALFGVDSALARRALNEAGFRLVVEAGLGSGAKDFRAMRIHTFAGAKDSRDMWAADAQREITTDTPAYRNLKTPRLDQCGITLLAGRAVGAPFRASQ